MLTGEEDIINRNEYTCSLRCYSTKGALYRIPREKLKSLQSHNTVWLQILEGIVLKEQNLVGGHIRSQDLGDKPKETNQNQSN